MSWLRRGRRALCAAVGLATCLPAGLARAEGGGDLTDPAGDTFAQDDGTPLDVPEADILRSAVRVSADTITLVVQVRRPTDPLSDKGWQGATEIYWDLDTTGDGQPDFATYYYTDGGRITGGVYRSTESDEDQPRLCELRATTFSPEAGYTAAIDRACVGALQTVAYLADFSYDTGPDDEEAPVGEDVAPDEGMAPAQPGA